MSACLNRSTLMRLALPTFVGWVAISGCAPLRLSSSLPAYKSQYGLTPKQKLQRLEQLAESATQLSEAERAVKTQELLQVLSEQRDPALRVGIVGALASMENQAAAEGLKVASKDDEPRVRLATVDAWQRCKHPDAVANLGALATEDEDIDVRIAAVRALGSFQSEDATKLLANRQQDRDPAIRAAAAAAANRR